MNNDFGLIGEKLIHSFSPEIHSVIGNYPYELKELSPDELGDFLKNTEFSGINVTIPYKKDVIPHLDFVEENAKNIGAVNTIVNKDGKLSGYNTDFAGMRALIVNNGINIKGKKVLILGTGGTSNTACAVAKNLEAAEILRVSRSKKDGVISYEEAYSDYSDANIIINTTPSGMYPNVDAMPIDIDQFTGVEAIVDVIYNPLNTKLTVEAHKRGIKAVGGLYMLVAQAVYASGYFFDKEINKEDIDRIYKELYNEKQNIVIVGMPSAGKTSVGRELAKRLNMTFVDSDDVIVENIGMSIKDYFAQNNEKAFRDRESEAILDIAKKNNQVIATGGGVVLRQENVDFLKMNGEIVFLDRNVEDLLVTDDRPLSKSMDAIKEMYKIRRPLYEAAADKTVKVIGNLKETIDTVEGVTK